MSEEVAVRYRLRFNKLQHLRYIGHLDLHRAMERTLRRAKLPLDYSKGFNPRVKLSLSVAIPLGCTSLAELADIWLVAPLDEEVILTALVSAAPPGLAFISVEQIDAKTPSLQSQIIAMSYAAMIPADDSTTRVAEAVRALLEAEELPRTRRNKPYDLRPLIHELYAEPHDGGSIIVGMTVKAGEGETGRPEEVLLALGLDPTLAQIERTALVLDSAK